MPTRSPWPLLLELAERLDAAQVAYTFVESTALMMQGVAVPPLAAIDLIVQWDLFDAVHALFAADGAGPVAQTENRAAFQFTRDGFTVNVACLYNTVVAADPERVPVAHEGRQLWVRSLLSYRRRTAPGDPHRDLITARLRQLQADLTAHNAAAWSLEPYDAWVQRHGNPPELAERLKQEPAARLASLLPYLGELKGKRVINLMGSHGAKAVAMALLGAEVTVVDISPENARYATALADAAGVPLRYVVSDVLALPGAERTADYDLVLLELGILHYFIDLEPLTRLVAELLADRGRLVLQDFHPISKLISLKGHKHKVSGNYFNPLPERVPVAYHKYSPGDPAAPYVLERRWTLGEVATAVADAGLHIEQLVEEPNTRLADVGIPKTFTVVASKLPRPAAP
ncbi:MAG: class I SAM-dependent methyltransferase [Mycobacterium leprae]